MDSKNEVWDTIIVGAGAAGLLAAASAAQRGRSILLLEKNNKLGVKILMSGGTRCNITHHCSAKEIVKAFGPNGRFLHSSLANLPPDAVVRLFNKLGVKTKVEETGKVFPVSNRAIEVRDALVSFAKEAGARIFKQSPVLHVSKSNNEFIVETETDSFRSNTLLITTGGKSYPGCGTTGDGYAWATQFGHTITPLGPGLTPLVSQVPWANELKGISVDAVNTQLVDSAGKLHESSLTPILFTHFGFSGPSAMNVSRAIPLFPDKRFDLVLDLAPNQKNEESLFENLLAQTKTESTARLDSLLPKPWPKRLRESFLSANSFNKTQRLAEVSKSELRRLAHQLKRSQFPIHGTRGYAKAEVTTGGVKLNEVDSKTMESKICPGLFFAGEILNLDGPIGGFNFQSAFCTGWTAGQNV